MTGPVETETADRPVRRRRGRPPVSLEHKRRTNAERQRRFRIRRAAELQELRQLRPAPRPPRETRPPSSAPAPVKPPDFVLELHALP